MKVNLILAASLAFASAAAQADNVDPASAKAGITSNAPKNLARQHLGANMLQYDAANQAYVPTEAAAAWLDDDIATGWPAQTGVQDYLLALPEAELVNNFCISARSATGTVSLYAGDEAALPGAKSWTLIEKDVPVESINEKLGRPFGRFAKYLLIESNLTESGPWYSIYVYGERAATAYHIQERAQPVDPRTVFGPYTNPATSISLSSLYAHCKVATAGGDAASWNNAIDDDPSTGTFVAATQNEPGLAIQYDKSYAVQRVSVLTDAGTKGKLEFFVENAAPAAPAAGATTSADDKSQYIKVANETAALGSDSTAAAPVAAAGSTSTDLTKQTPVATVNFDGSTTRASVDFTPTTGAMLVARWTPDTAGTPLNVRELNSFGNLALNDYELAPDAVAEGPGTETSGKEEIPANGDGKTALPPSIGEGLPAKTAFIPGVPVFPPNIPFSP